MLSVAVVACCAASTNGQFGGGGTAPSTNSLLNDLRAIQFPPGGQQQQQQGQATGGLGMGGGMGGFGGGMGATGFGATGQQAPTVGGGAFGGGGFGGLGAFGAGAAQPQGMGMGLGGGMQQPGGMGMGMGGMPPMGAQPGAQAAQAPGADEGTMDLLCMDGPRAAAWQQVKRRFNAIFESGQGPFMLAPREALQASMEGALNDLKSVGGLSPEAAEECGLGKLTLQLLSFAAIDDPTALVQLFGSFEQLTSPVLTMLLDVPWAALAASGWPIFGLMGQMNLRKQHVEGAMNTEALDGLADPISQQFLAYLLTALQNGDANMMQQAGAAYLQADGESPQGGSGSALGPLTAIAAQAAAAANVQDRGAFLQGMQQGFKQVIGSGPELDIALSTNWPLWGLLHVSMSSFAI